MNRREVQAQVRPMRRDLVVAAEKVMQGAFQNGKAKLTKTQLSQLIGVCGEASCHEEIANYLRYQAGRSGQSSWDLGLVRQVIGGIEPMVEKLDDTVAVEAWRRYATYLSRAFTYQDAVSKASGGK